MKKIILLMLPLSLLMAIDFTMTKDGLYPDKTTEEVQTEATSTLNTIIQNDTSTSKYLEPVNLPECDANNPEVQFIKIDADWSTINNANKSIFCVSPGDYRSLGNIKLTASGTAAKRRYIVLNNGNNIHPGKLTTNEVANYALEFTGNSSYWIVDRLSSMSPSVSESIILRAGSTYNIINKSFTNNNTVSVMIKEDANNNTIQNCRFEGMTLDARLHDKSAISLFSWNTESFEIKNTKIINNEIVDANDAVQLIRSPRPSDGKYQDGNCEGTIIDSNDMYITSNLYTNGKGVRDTDGSHAYAENAIDLKIGSTNASNPMIITNNRVWGYRQSDTTNSYLSSPGSAISGHYEVKHTKINDNIIFDSHYGINMGARYRFPYALDDVEIHNNLIYNCGKVSGAGAEGHAIGIAQGRNVSIMNNTLISIRTEYASIIYNSDKIQFTNNDIINSPYGIIWHDNAKDSINILTNNYTSAAEVGRIKHYIFTTDKFTNNPRVITLKSVI